MTQLNPLEDLLDLQVIDLEIDRLLEERSSLPALDAYRQAHDAAEAAAAELAAAEEEAKRIHLALDKSDGELTIAEEKRDAEERRLYAGGLNARETEALMKEVEMLKRKTSEMEEHTLALMEERDAHQQVVYAGATQLAGLRAEEERLEGVIRAAWGEIDAAVAKEETKKTDAVKAVAPDLMEIYEELRPIKDGVAIGRLGEGICGGCHLRLSEAEQLEAARSDPPRCVHCRRIIIL
jgi:predicted  nucleic acid-binding Zn-ribbon protein